MCRIRKNEVNDWLRCVCVCVHVCTAEHKSVIVAVPVLADYVSNQADLAEGAQFLFDIHKAGALKLEIAKKVSTSSSSSCSTQTSFMLILIQSRFATDPKTS